MKVEAYATRARPHYLRHLAPIMAALPEGLRGRVHRGNEALRGGDGPVVIAGGHDIDQVPKHRPIVLVEHGAGQRYRGLDHPAYSGGRGRERVDLFLCPNAEVAEANASRYPLAAVEVVGCPALDRHVAGPGPRAVAITFHFDPLTGAGVPEMRPAFAHYEPHLRAVVAQLEARGISVVGHGHPRWGQARRVWARAGVEWCGDWDEVLGAVGAVVVDNSSVGFEAAALGRGVVWLNAPWYRRDVEHGLRFWSHAGVGHQVDHADAICEAAERALVGPADAALAARVFGPLGEASARAADAVVRRYG